ncbi:hypothetical protein DFH06DRAFT_1158022 [Mycena polygramma]|nr:hypothetical protein DFH06DRAFT_1158022 [Mycena polygramma]
MFAKAANPPAAPANFKEPEILEVDAPESTSTRHIPAPQSSRATTISEVIDLTESPETRKPTRVRATREQPLEIIDLSVLPPASSSRPAAATVEIDLSLDSPEFVALVLPEPTPATIDLLPQPTTKLPNPPAVVIDLPSIEIAHGGLPVSPGERTTPESPSMSSLELPDTPTPSTPNTVVHFPSMEVDDIDQKPLSLLLQKLAVSDPPQGGTLGPAWMRERFEASDHFTTWRQIFEQKTSKPSSRQKPQSKQFDGDLRHPFLVLPIFDSETVKLKEEFKLKSSVFFH